MVQINLSFLSNSQPFNNRYEAGRPITKRPDEQSPTQQNRTAIQVTISNEAYNQYEILRNLKMSSTTSEENTQLVSNFRAHIEEFNSEEAIEQRRLDMIEKKKEKAELHPLENEFQILGVKYALTEGTIEYKIASALEGKVKNPSLYAVHLKEAISGNPYANTSIEEKALHREVALEHARYVANNYFDSEEEAKEFLADIEAYAKKAELHDRGYKTSNGEVYRNYTDPLGQNGNVSFGELAKRYMDKEYYERFIAGEGTAAESMAFLLDIQKNQVKYRNEFADEFVENENKVIAIQDDAKKFIGEITWDNDNFVKMIEDAFQDTDYTDIAKWNQNMLNLFL